MLESTYLVFKKIEAAHLQDVYAIYDNENVVTYCGITPKHNLQTVSKGIDHFERDYQKKSRVKWGIFPKNQNDELAGIIECMDFHPKVNMVTIGFFLTEASKKVLLKNGFVKEGLVRQASFWSGKGVIDLEI
ncbi:hypothetical protein J6TS7_61000 [Paenibacillus dendritiformis]|nr:hypothetical protein J6TS7_61000 [Paenibacillus dendritiformis]